MKARRHRRATTSDLLVQNGRCSAGVILTGAVSQAKGRISRADRWCPGCTATKRALTALTFQRAKRLIIHIPFLQDSKDGLHSESSPRQLPEDSRRVFLIFRFLQPLL